MTPSEESYRPAGPLPDLDDGPTALSLDEDDPAPPEIMDKAGDLLSRRARTERDLTQRLLGLDFDTNEVNAAISSLRRLGLVDDAAFAKEWMASRQGAKALGREALLDRLEAKGIDRETAARSLDESGYDEIKAAGEVARAHLRRMSHLSPVKQAARLGRLLSGRGFEPEAVEAAIKDVMPPEGWD